MSKTSYVCFMQPKLVIMLPKNITLNEIFLKPIIMER